MRCEIMMYLLLLAAVVVSAQEPAVDKKIPEVGQHCMDCICQASSDCNAAAKCHKDPGGGYLCGPYVISWAYWHDGGKPGDRGNPKDFETCLTNRTCAEVAVRGYMRRYGQDCDASGRVDCYDFSRIHKLGFGPACSKDAILVSTYWDKFVECYHEERDQPPAAVVVDDHPERLTSHDEYDEDEYYEWGYR